MDDARTAGLSLLERAASYCLGSLSMVTPGALDQRTPCTAWDLRALLRHMDDSLVALCEAVAVGAVGAEPPERDDAPDDVLVSLRNNACRLLGAWANASGPGSVGVGGQRLPAVIVAGTGALEIAVHGWDVARACQEDRPIPAALAEELLDVALLVVTGADRPARFGRPVPVSPSAPPGSRLVAFLGRTP